MFKYTSLFCLFTCLFFACTGSDERKNCDCPPFVAMESTVKQYLKNLKTHQQDFDNSLQTLFNTKNKVCTAHAHELLSRAYYSKNNLDSAELFANRALAFLNTQNCSNDLLLSVYKDLNNIHNNRAEFAKCVEWELKINEMVALKRDTPDLAMSFLSIANVFNRVHQEKTGLFYCRKAIPLIAALNNSSIKAQLFTRAAQRYFYSFEQLNDPSLLDTSALYAQEAYNIMLSTPVERCILKCMIKKRYFTTQHGHLSNAGDKPK